MSNKKNFDVTTALTLVLPDQFTENVNAVRAKYDRAYPRWMPHINYIFPFVEAERFPDIVATLQEAFANEGLSSFTLRLNKLEYFKRKKDVTFHLKPEDQSGLERVYNVIRKALPDVYVKHPTYQAHMTLGQCKKSEFDSVKSEIGEAFNDVEFEVDRVYLIKRVDNKPFEVVYTISFAKEASQESL